MKKLRALAIIAGMLSGTAFAQVIEVVPVISRALDRKIELPGEIVPYLKVPIHAKVAGFVDRVLVDRGSIVRRGQLLATMTAPEMNAQRAEAIAKVRAAEGQQAEAEARVAAAQSTYVRMKSASETPGVIAGNELTQAEKQMDAERAKVAAAQSSVQAARAAQKAVEDVQAYLRVTAPFDGVITERNVHPGALAGTAENAAPMFELETVNRLRLVVPVPEAAVGAIVRGAMVEFKVPAYPGVSFYGRVSRVAHSIDAKTRSMPVELEVPNGNGRLASGMYPTVTWPVHGSQPVMLVPPASIVNTSERSFVIRVRNGTAEWVDVKRGAAQGDLVEVVGPLSSGDFVARRGTDEIRPGARLKTRVAPGSKS